MKISSLKSKNLIARIKASQDKIFGKYFLLVKSASDNKIELNYLLIVTKKIGNAVTRNYIKRRFRHLLRRNMEQVNLGYDYSIIAKKSIIGIGFSELEKDFLSVVKRAA